MCEPATIMGAIAAIGSAAQARAVNKQAEAQSKALNIQAENEREEIQAATEEEVGQRVKAAREARARARVAAGESGALGASFAASINQSIQDQDNDIALASKNLAFKDRDIDDRLRTGMSNVRRVSGLEAGLSIATAAANGYVAGQSLDRALEGET